MPTRPCRRCSTSSSRSSTTCRRARSAISACAATPRWRPPSAPRAPSRFGICRKSPATELRASPATACNLRTANRTASGGSKPARFSPPSSAALAGMASPTPSIASRNSNLKPGPMKQAPDRTSTPPESFSSRLPKANSARPATRSPCSRASSSKSCGSSTAHRRRARRASNARIATWAACRACRRVTIAVPSPKSPAKRSTTTARNRTTSSTARTTRSPTPVYFRSI